MHIAQLNNADAQALKAIDDLQSSQIKRYQAQWQALIERSFELAPEQLPAVPVEPPGKAMSGLGKRLKACVNDTADSLQVAPEMLARKKDLEYILTSVQQGAPELPASLKGWRSQALGEQLLHIAEQADG